MSDRRIQQLRAELKRLEEERSLTSKPPKRTPNPHIYVALAPEHAIAQEVVLAYMRRQRPSYKPIKLLRDALAWVESPASPTRLLRPPSPGGSRGKRNLCMLKAYCNLRDQQEIFARLERLPELYPAQKAVLECETRPMLLRRVLWSYMLLGVFADLDYTGQIPEEIERCI